jgi:hypothetical protein
MNSWGTVLFSRSTVLCGVIEILLRLPWITKQFSSECGFCLRLQYFLYTKGLWEPKEFTKDRYSQFVNIVESYIFLPAIEVR